MMLAVLVGLLMAVMASAQTPLSELKNDFEYQQATFEMVQTRTNLDGDDNYRLVDTVQPSYYVIDLDVYLSERRFNGQASITVSVSSNISQIVLHQKLASIESTTVTDLNDNIVQLNLASPIEYDSVYEIMKINFANTITDGDYKILITYTGIINENPFDRGFYLGYYYYNSEKRYYATTQFQPYHARKAFPCFDEPRFKSIYVLSITRAPELSQSYSNMAIESTEVLANGRIRETFYPTPTISSYLIAFHVSDFIETSSYGTASKYVGIVSRPGVTTQHTYAGQQALDITDWLSNYTQNDYYDHAHEGSMKNHHIALPDFPSGAMENWGMVNYREAYLLFDEDNTNLASQVFISTIIAHEMGHKWFGNLVTCFWWSNLWLNESFASFFEYFAAGGVNSELELDKTFVVDAVQSALLSDSSASATPMNYPSVSDYASISGHFSTTSYAKGASVLRMMEHFVGASTFRKALADYLSTNQYGVGTPEDMYAAFTTAVAEDNSLSNYDGVNIATVFQSWVDQGGAPVVNVDINYGTGAMEIKQERFFINGNSGNGQLWQIPITYTRGSDVDFDNTKPDFVLTTESITINKPAGHEWVIFNKAASGFYRINYDDHSWEMIASGLRNSREVINHLSRSRIVNDVLNFLRAGKVSYVRAFDVIRFLVDETDYYVWAGALTPLSWFRRRLLHTDAKEVFENYLLTQMNTAIETLGYTESTTDRTSIKLNRIQIMSLACELGHQGCINYSVEAYQSWRSNQANTITPNLRRWVYCNGVRHGNYSDYEFLWNKYTESSNAADMVIILRSLGCTRDVTALNHLLQQSLNNDLIRYHDRTNVFTYALLGNQENVATVLQFVYNNYATMRENYGGSARLNIALSALATYIADEEQLNEFEQWLTTNEANLPGEYATGVSVVSTVRSFLQYGNNVAPNFIDTISSANENFIVSLTLILSMLVMHLLR